MGWTAAILVLAACGRNGTTVDASAPPPDRPVDSPPVCTRTMCGATCCATAADDCAPSCTCPSGIVPQPFATVVAQMDTVRKAPAVLGIGVMNGTDARLHALVVGFDPVAAPLDTGIALPSAPLGDAPFVGLGYDITIASKTTRSNFFASQGTLTLTRRCAAGVAGSITGVTMREQTSADDPTPDPMGCTLTIPDLSFDFGVACP